MNRQQSSGARGALAINYLSAAVLWLGLLSLVAPTSQAQQVSSETVANETMQLPSKRVSFGDCRMWDLQAKLYNDRLPPVSSPCPPNSTYAVGEDRRWGYDRSPHQPVLDYIFLWVNSSCNFQAPVGAEWNRQIYKVNSGGFYYLHERWRTWNRDHNDNKVLVHNKTQTECRQSYQLADTTEEPCVETACGTGEGFATTATVGTDSTIQCECQPLSPIFIDLGGDGIKLTGARQGIKFDLDGDWVRNYVSWPESGDDVALVRNDEGVIYEGAQLFGDLSPQSPEAFPGEKKNGYRALRLWDDDRDGSITPADASWNMLAVWRDDNRDGLTTPSELLPLSSVGIEAISLGYKESRKKDRHGNEYRYRSKVTVNGQRRYCYDVWLTSEASEEAPPRTHKSPPLTIETF